MGFESFANKSLWDFARPFFQKGDNFLIFDEDIFELSEFGVFAKSLYEALIGVGNVVDVEVPKCQNS